MLNTESPRRKPKTPQPLEAARNPDALLHLAIVSALVGLARSAIYARVKNGDFPPPIRLSSRCSRWRAGDVTAWLESKKAA